MSEAHRSSSSRFGAHATDVQKISENISRPPFPPPHKGLAARQIIMDGRHPTNTPPHHLDHHQPSLYPPPSLPTVNSRASHAMYGPTTLAFYNQDNHYLPRAPPAPPASLLSTSISPDHLTLTAPSGSGGFDHQDGLVYGQHSNVQRWPGIFPDPSHSQSISPHDGSNTPHQSAGMPLMPHSQAPNQTYQISPIAQSVNPLLYNDLMQMQQSPGNFLQPPDPYGQPRTSSGWTLRAPATAGAPSLDQLANLDPRSSMGDTSPTNSIPPAVGRQGTRGILPSAPGRDDPAGGEDEIEPIQDPKTKKWQCPSCPATFSFPKHVKRHYMRREHRIALICHRIDD
jgi:hypothetical protein